MKTLKVTYSFSVPDEADADAVAEAIFDLLCGMEDAPYESSDNFEQVILDGVRVS